MPGFETALHPHWAMAIEDGRDVERLLDSSDVGLCLDTGHLYLAGTDPVDVARMAPGRVLHVHLKDVDRRRWPSRCAAARCLFRQAVIDGLFTPLGAGGVDIEGVIRTLEGDGFRGWYVLEQDVVAGRRAGSRAPVRMADAVESVAFLRQLAATL